MNETIEKISNIVSSYTGIPIEIMRLETRRQEIVKTRYLICYLTRKYAEEGPMQITRHGISFRTATFLGMNHSTVSYGIKQIGDWIDTNTNMDIVKTYIDICSILGIKDNVKQRKLVKL